MAAAYHDFFVGKNVLVTGGAGLAGAHILKKLLETGAYIIRATYHRKLPVIHNRDRIEYIKADLTKEDDCARVVRGMDYVFMCAANTSGATVIEETPLVHVTSTVVMATWMLDKAYKAGVKKFLWTSSTVVYPVADYPVREEDAVGDVFHKYFFAGETRRFIEKLCEMYAVKIKNPSMQVVVLRPSNFYGEYASFDPRESHVIPALITHVVERRDPIILYGDGSDVRDFLYAEDLADAALLAMEKVTTFGPLNIGTGKGCSLNELLEIILEVDGYTDARIVHDDSSLMPLMIPLRLIDVTKARELIGFQAKTPLREGIRRMVDWYRREQNLTLQ